MVAVQTRQEAPAVTNDELLQKAAIQYEVEQFLHNEAALLDAHDYQAWLKLLADDIHYFMPVRRTVTRTDADLEFTKPGEVAFFDDVKIVLENRVKKLEAGSAWSEEPRSRSRHFVSNVRILKDAGDELTVECCFHLTRSRLASEHDSWIGRRVDVLRRTVDGFLLAKRELYLDDTTILSANLSTLF